jgi:hypothetical protein
LSKFITSGASFSSGDSFFIGGGGLSGGLILPGAQPGVGSPANGLLKRVYPRYIGDIFSDFATTTPSSTSGDTLVAVSNIGDNYSVQWTGYFIVPESGSYQFTIASDDGSWLWMGNPAVDGYNASNAIINNGGLHGLTGVNSAIYHLNAGDCYPIRIQFSELDGGDIFYMQYRYNKTGWLSTDGVFQYSTATPEGI